VQPLGAAFPCPTVLSEHGYFLGMSVNRLIAVRVFVMRCVVFCARVEPSALRCSGPATTPGPRDADKRRERIKGVSSFVLLT
jgi:hypothetical protein